MNALVTGGAGFIGGNLVSRLLKDGHWVTVLEKPTPGKKERLQKIAGNKKLEIIWADLADKNLSLPINLLKKIDWVFHLAGCWNNIVAKDSINIFHDVHVTATVRIIEACRKLQIKKFIYTASATCYGHPKIIPIPETAPIAPVSPYAVSKYVGEYYCLRLGLIYRLPVISLRSFQVYGTGESGCGFGPLLTNFVHQKMTGQPYTVYGNGEQRLDFIHIDDLVGAYLLAAQSKVAGEIFNVGSGTERTLNEILGLLVGKIKYLPRRKSDSNCMYADIAKIKRVLGWSPRISLEEGTERLLKNLESSKKMKWYD